MSMIKITDEELIFTYARSGGSGGQNVNKVNTKATLRWNIESNTQLPPAQIKRFKQKYQRFFNKQGEVVIHSDTKRTQKQNRDECLRKLSVMLKKVEKAPKKRIPTKPTKSSVDRRLKSKKIHSDRKKERSKRYD
jgi:ribosome-associated protein